MPAAGQMTIVARKAPQGDGGQRRRTIVFAALKSACAFSVLRLFAWRQRPSLDAGNSHQHLCRRGWHFASAGLVPATLEDRHTIFEDGMRVTSQPCSKFKFTPPWVLELKESVYAVVCC